MNREYHRWYSSSLHRDMELLVFGHAGTPVLVFPTSLGKHFEFEDRGMIGVVWNRIEQGAVQFYCVDSIDAESWYNKSIHPHHRVMRHEQYERYLLNEVVPLIRQKNPSWELVTTGCSFGAYHALNLALRHPGLVTGVVTMGGAFDIHQFLDGYYDDSCYFNCPTDFLPNLNDNWTLDQIRRQRLVLATGEHDICLGENRRLSGILNSKSLPHWLDVWGDGSYHDWPCWQRMAVKFF